MKANFKKFVVTYDDTPMTTCIRRVDNRRYHVVKLDDLYDCCGESEAKEIGGRYSASLKEIDLDLMTDKQTQDVLSYVGQDDTLDDPYLAECACDYGLGAPLYADISNNRNRLIAACKKESYSLTADKEKYLEAMQRPVNALGSTAAEFGQGDFFSGMTRGVKADDPKACLMAKVYGATDEAIEKVKQGPELIKPEYSIDQVGSHFAGFNDGLNSAPKQANNPLYLKGYREGIAYKTEKH